MALRPTDPLPPPTPALATELRGLWLLRRREDHDAQGTRHIDPVLGADPIGILVLGAESFAAQFSRRDRTAPVAAIAAGANNSAAVDGYDAYFGSYHFDPAQGAIVTTLEGSVGTANIGKTFSREVRVVDGQLVIQLATTTPAGIAVTRRLIFDRAP